MELVASSLVSFVRGRIQGHDTLRTKQTNSERHQNLRGRARCRRTSSRPLSTRLNLVLTQRADNTFAARRAEQTSFALILPSPVGGLRLAVPARCFAKLRSDKNQTKHSGSRFHAGSLQSICRVCGGRTCVTYREIDRSRDAGAAAAVPVVCRSGAGRRQAETGPLGRTR